MLRDLLSAIWKTNSSFWSFLLSRLEAPMSMLLTEVSLLMIFEFPALTLRRCPADKGSAMCQRGRCCGLAGISTTDGLRDNAGNSKPIRSKEESVFDQGCQILSLRPQGTVSGE
jgi:hypothetical protein